MKELSLSFNLNIPSKRHDVHWIEDKLLKLREETFLKVFRQILVRIEQEALEEIERCERFGEVLARNGREVKKIRALLVSLRVARDGLCCQGCGEERYPLDEV